MNLLPSFLQRGSEDDQDEPAREAMPIDSMVGLLEALREDLESVEMDEEQFEPILEQLEQVDSLVPGRAVDSVERLESHPPEDRTLMWFEWIEKRLSSADAEDPENPDLQIRLEDEIIALEDVVDEQLPIDPSTGRAESWEYEFTELDIENFKGHETKAEGIDYDAIDRALADFREDHSEFLVEGEDGQQTVREDIVIESIEEDVDDQETDDNEEPGSGRRLGDRFSIFSGGEEDVEEQSEETGDQDDRRDDQEDVEDAPTLLEWKYELLERDPHPADVEESTIYKLLAEGYISDREDLEVFAGPEAREMMEAHRSEPTQPLWIGREHRTGREVPIEQKYLFQHQAIWGVTGYGKSTLLKNEFRQLMEAGFGGAFIDPKGDDSRELMQVIPDHRLEDVIWIEPASTRDYATGFNFLEVGLDEDDPNFDTALESLVDDLVKMLGAGKYWGPRMDRVSQSLIRAMNLSKHEFNLLDMYYILADERSRRAFAGLVEEEGLDFVDVYINEIADMDDDDLEPLLGRFQKWVENPIARRLIAFRDSPINIAEAVEQDKIIVVRMGQESKDLKRMLSMAVLRRIWSAIRARSEQVASERNPFFLFMDEFDNVARDDESIPSMLSESRSYRLSVTAASQYPSQLTEDVLQGIHVNTDTKLTFNPGHIDEARKIAPSLDKDPQSLLNEGNYHVWTRLQYRNGEQTDAFKTYTLPPYPPLRRMEEADAVIEESLETYGRSMTDDDIKEGLKFQYGRGELERRGVAGTEETTDPEHRKASAQVRDALFKAIYTTQIKRDSKGGFVPMTAVEEEWERRAGGLGYQSKPAQILEQLPEELVRQESRADDLYIKLTPEALEKAGLTQDTGSSASAGGKMHRWVLSQAFEAFTKWNCEVELPEQGEGELPDGLADLPIDPIARVQRTDDPRAFREAVESLREQYPQLYELTGGRHISIEAETTTIENPMQTLTNLRKAANSGRFCLFAVKPPTEKGRAPDEARFGYWARRGEQVIHRTERSGSHIESIDYDEVTCVRETSEEGHRRFYNGDPIALEDETIPLRPKSSSDLAWWEIDGEVILREENGGEVVARFDDVQDLEDPDKTAFPAYAVVEEGAITVYEGGESYQYEDREMMEEDWSYIHAPFIPELQFDDGLPSSEDFAFVVFPHADSEPDEPMIVEGEEQRPLLPDDLEMPGEAEEPSRRDGAGDQDDRRDEQQDVDEELPEEEDVDELPEGYLEELNEFVDEVSGSGDEHIPDFRPIDGVTPGQRVSIDAEVADIDSPQTVTPVQADGKVKMRQATIEDETGEMEVRLWKEHTERDLEIGDRVQLVDISIEREVQNSIFGPIGQVDDRSLVIPGPVSAISRDQPQGEDATPEPESPSDGGISVGQSGDESSDEEDIGAGRDGEDVQEGPVEVDVDQSGTEEEEAADWDGLLP